MNLLKRAVSYMTAAATLAFMFASGFDMTEKYMDKLDGKADKRDGGRIQ